MHCHIFKEEIFLFSQYKYANTQYTVVFITLMENLGILTLIRQDKEEFFLLACNQYANFDKGDHRELRIWPGIAK